MKCTFKILAVLGVLAGVMYGAVLILEKIISKTRLKV